MVNGREMEETKAKRSLDKNQRDRRKGGITQKNV